MKINKIGYEVYKLRYSFIVLNSGCDLKDCDLKGCIFSCCVYSKLNDDIALNIFYRLFTDGTFTESLK